MSQTALMWLALYLGGMASAFLRGPIFGLLTYMYTFYTQFSWAKGAPHYRWSFFAAIGILIIYFLKKNSLTKLSYMRMPQMKWLILVFINMLCVTPFAVNPAANKIVVIDFFKLVLLYYLIICCVQSKMHYKLFIWVQVWGNFLFGWQAFDRGKGSGGRIENIGGPGIKNSNSLANHLITVFPFLGNMVLFGNKWERIGAVVAAAFIANGVILCGSRGAFMGVVTILILTLIFYRKGVGKGVRIKIVIGIILGSIAFSQLAPESFWARMNTIDDYEEDGSATGRLDTWKGGIEMLQDYPLGKGGDAWYSFCSAYIPDVVSSHHGEARSMHNSYLQMATSWGVQGLSLLLVFFYTTIAELHRMRKRSGTNNDMFYYTESIAIEVSLLGFFVGAIFGSRIYSESIYWYCAIATALSNIQQSEIIDNNKVKLSLSEINMGKHAI